MCIYWIGTYTCGCVGEGLKEPCDRAPDCDEAATAEQREYLDLCRECHGRRDLIAKRAEIVRSLEGAQDEEVEVDKPATENDGQTETDSGEKILENEEKQDSDTVQMPPVLKVDVDGKSFLLFPERCDLTKGPCPVRRRRGERFPRRGRTYPKDEEWMY